MRNMSVTSLPQSQLRVPVGNIKIKGHFSGGVTTASHHLEVTAPVVHEVPILAVDTLLSSFVLHAEEEGADIVNMWRDLRTVLVDAPGRENRTKEIMKMAASASLQSNGSPRNSNSHLEPISEQVEQSEEIQEGSKADLLASKQVLAMDARLREVTEERDSMRRELQTFRERQLDGISCPPLPKLGDCQQESTSDAEVERLNRLLQERSKELLDAQNDLARQQMEVLQLRSKNAMLAGYLASAESSAHKLRSRLNQTEHSDELGIANKPHRQPTDSCIGGQLALVSEADLCSTTPVRALTPRSPRLAIGAATSAGLRTPPRRAQISVQETSGDPLVSDLKELERWAHELRTLRSL